MGVPWVLLACLERADRRVVPREPGGPTAVARRWSIVSALAVDQLGAFARPRSGADLFECVLFECVCGRARGVLRFTTDGYLCRAESHCGKKRERWTRRTK